jgi:hypothetical protein
VRHDRGRALPLVIALVVATAATAAARTLLIAHDADAAAFVDLDARGRAADGPDDVRPSGFRVWAVDDAGRTVRWDPCATITLVVDPAGAPEGALDDLAAAIELLVAAGAPPLAIEALTAERPSATREPYQPERYGERWAPVLVAWARPGEGALPLRAQDRGIAIPVAVRIDGVHAFVSGQVVLNATRTDLVAGSEDRATSWGATIAHELGHLVGLGHVDDARELMSADPGRGPVELGPGDRAGLAHLGDDRRCAPAPPPRRLPLRPADPDDPTGVSPGG